MGRYLFIHLLMVISFSIDAACEYIIYPYQSGMSGAMGTHRLSGPRDGIANDWRSGGANDGWNGLLPGLTHSIDLTSNNSFQPSGAILTSAGGIPFTTYARKGGGYAPEQVFFRCTPDTAGQLFEAWSTNGDDLYAGWSQATDVPGAFLTTVKNVALRITNDESGRPFLSTWQQRPLENLDTDSAGNFLIKAKNFSSISVELLKTVDTRFFITDAPTNFDQFINPNAYLVFRGPGLLTWLIKIGQPHFGNWSGWPNAWPSVISLYGNNIAVKRAATCQVIDFPRQVVFPVITRAQLNRKEYATASIRLLFSCESNILSGIYPNNRNVALGFLAPLSSIVSAWQNGLDSGLPVSWLLDTAYGTPGHSRGVGVRIYRSGKAIRFLFDSIPGSGPDSGWMPILDGNQQLLVSANGINYFEDILEARLENFNKEPVTAGSYQSHAQILLRIQ